jgi:hypothetical protein
MIEDGDVLGEDPGLFASAIRSAMRRRGWSRVGVDLAEDVAGVGGGVPVEVRRPIRGALSRGAPSVAAPSRFRLKLPVTIALNRPGQCLRVQPLRQPSDHLLPPRGNEFRGGGV